MGYDLSNATGDYHQWKVLGWWAVLNMGRAYGWMPRGTEAPEHPEDADPWDGNYFMNAGQQVSAEDAAALADALERLLQDPAREARAEQTHRSMQEALHSSSIQQAEDPTDVLKYPLGFIRDMLRRFGDTRMGSWSFGEKDNNYLRQFIAFCRRGAFTIG